MREAIGSSLLFNLIITIFVIMFVILINSLAYSKAFKVKNRIINIIEKNKGFDNELKVEIDEELENMGYRISNVNTCKEIEGAELKTDISYTNHYDYCVYEIKTCEGHGDDEHCNSYYKVKTYMNFPMFKKFLKFSVWGETKVFYDTYINIEEE